MTTHTKTTHEKIGGGAIMLGELPSTLYKCAVVTGPVETIHP